MILDGALAGTPITRVLGTHLHPEPYRARRLAVPKFDAPLLMTR